MRRELMLLVLIVLTLILASCGTNSGPGQRSYQEFRTGTEGLRLEFLPNLPPSRIFDDQEFNVNVKVSNVGAETVGNNDRIYLWGFDPSLITGVTTFGESLKNIEGKTQYNLQGTFDFVTFKGIPRNLRSKNLDRYPFNLIATTCYGYRTLAQTNVCIDPDPYSPTAKQKACNVDQYTSVSPGSQGAPISVPSITVEPSQGRTRFIITVQNAGIGQPFKFGPEFLAKCSPYDSGLLFNEVDAVRIDKVEISGTDITSTCKPLDQGHIRLFNNQGTITCELATQRGSAAFLTPILIDLKYGYKQSIEKQVEIVAVQ